MRVGSEVLSRCGKCKTATEHKILALTGEVPVKVECLLCHSQHKYRPLEAQKPKKERKPKKAKDPPKLELVHSRPSLASRVEGKVPVAYMPGCAFATGDVIEHPMFGIGIALALVGPRTVEVEFASGLKKLAHDLALPRPMPKLTYHAVMAPSLTTSPSL